MSLTDVKFTREIQVRRTDHSVRNICLLIRYPISVFVEERPSGYKQTFNGGEGRGPMERV
jgi:hypothetical protein